MGLLAGFLLLASAAQAGFFRVEERDGRWWLIDNEGKPFLAKAVNCVDMGPKPADFDSKNPAYCALKLYRSAEAWGSATARRLRGWGFNTIGGYSDSPVMHGQGMPYTVALVMGGWFGLPWVDIMDKDSLAKLDEVAAEAAKKYRDDPLCIGYFMDNELGWWDETAFLYWMARPATERLKGVLLEMLRAEYRGDVRRLLRDFSIDPKPRKFDDLKAELKAVRWAPGRRPTVCEKFIEALADDYYTAAGAALRKADPNHLVMGDRYLSFYSQPVARAAGRKMDVVTVNYNTFASSGWILPSFFESLYRLTGRPIMVTEYYFSAMENRTGNRNISGPFMVVGTQEERAAGAREMTERLWRLPYVVGTHWFQFADEPPLGRADGEDFNFGLVDNVDRPYEGLVAGFTDVHTRAEDLHREGRKREGLANEGGAWRVPRAAWTRSVDGKLDEWDLPATWVPEPKAKAPFEPFGDFHVAWMPEGLLVGSVVMDFSDSSAPPSGPLDLKRMTLVVRRDGARPLEVSLRGFHEKVGPEPKAGPDGKKPPDNRPYAALTPLEGSAASASGVAGCQSHVSITTIAEVFVPVSALGGSPLAAGEKLRIGLSVRLRGDVKENYWPVSLAGKKNSRDLAAVTLAEAGP